MASTNATTNNDESIAGSVKTSICSAQLLAVVGSPMTMRHIGRNNNKSKCTKRKTTLKGREYMKKPAFLAV